MSLPSPLVRGRRGPSLASESVLVALLVLRVLENVRLEVDLVNAVEAFCRCWFLEMLEKDVDCDAGHCLAQMFPMHIVLSLLVVVDAGRFICLEYEAARGNIRCFRDADVLFSCRTVFICVVDDDTLTLREALLGHLLALGLALQCVVVHTDVGRHVSGCDCRFSATGASD